MCDSGRGSSSQDVPPAPRLNSQAARREANSLIAFFLFLPFLNKTNKTKEQSYSRMGCRLGVQKTYRGWEGPVSVLPQASSDSGQKISLLTISFFMCK